MPAVATAAGVIVARAQWPRRSAGSKAGCAARRRQQLPAPPPLPCRAVAAAAGGALEPPDLRELAKMAQIGITDEEVEEWTPQIGSIVEWFGELGKVDVTGVEPSLRAMGEESTLREDVPVSFPNKEDLLKQVPDKEGVYVKVPKISTEADA